MRLWDETGQLFNQPAIRQATKIEIRKSPLQGQGVFARKGFRPGNTIEISPVVLLSQQEKELLRHTLLFGYYFVVDDPEYAIAMGLGASSLFNHSYTANAEYSISTEDQAVAVRARRVIRKGDEITLNYNGHPDDHTPVYFPPESTEFAEYPEFPGGDSAKKRLYLKVIPGKGRGVFCNRRIKAGSLIETSPLLVLPAQDYPAISNTQLRDYIFHFDKENRVTALALGFGSLYNHALYPNATYEIEHANRLIRYYASEDISDGKEICINYDGSPGSEEWFKARNIACANSSPST